ncbi:ABC transporter ATP-binding protein [Dermacoccaceae bacterium W4C1]
MPGQEFTQLRAEQAQRFIDDEPLFDPVDFTVTPGSCVVLRGPNGSGKSTMLRMVTGQLMVSSGQVLLDEAPVDERDPRLRSVMAVLMDPVIGYRDLTTQDHLVLIDQTWGLPRDSCADRVNAMLSRWGIEHLRHRFRHEMSSGQRQLVDLG